MKHDTDIKVVLFAPAARRNPVDHYTGRSPD